MREFTFVGERRSKTAIEKNWTWQDGRLAAKQLFDALKANGIVPEEQNFINLWDDGGNLQDVELSGKVVGMGKAVCDELRRRGIEHIGIIHPAARGKVRSKGVYSAHIQEKLL